MKKKIILAAVPILTFAMTAGVFAQEYDYEKKDYWYQEAKALESFSDYKTMEELFTALGAADAGYDVNAFINSHMGEVMMEQCWHYVEWSDPMDEGLIEYWKNYEGGVLKEMHHVGDEEFEWASYVPMSAYEEENAEKKYPVMVVCRGGNDAKYTAECFGFVHYAAESQEYMVVMPTDREPDAVQKLLAELKEDYPVDESRIYITGNSMGGLTTLNNGWAYPETFAAIAPFGIGAQNNLTEEQTAKIAEVKMPINYLYGTMDCYHSFPITECGMKDVDTGVAEINALLSADDCVFEELTVEEAQKLVAESDDPVKQVTGLNYTYTWSEELDDTTYHFGEYRTEDGVPMYRVTIAQDGTHWHSPSYAKLVWEYFSQFSRDTESGALIVE